MQDKNLSVKPPSCHQTVWIEALAAVYNSCHFTVTPISHIYYPMWKGIPKIEIPLWNYSTGVWKPSLPSGPGVAFDISLSPLPAACYG